MFWKIRLFDRFAIWTDEGNLRFERSNARQIVALLALAPGNRLSRTELALKLRPEEPDLTHSLLRLKNDLSNAAITLRESHSSGFNGICTDNQASWLETDEFQIDYMGWQDKLAEACALEPLDRIAKLKEITKEFGGGLLREERWTWIGPWQEEAWLEQVKACRMLAETSLALFDRESARIAAHRLGEVAGGDPTVLADQVRILASIGLAPEARNAYETYIASSRRFGEAPKDLADLHWPTDVEATSISEPAATRGSDRQTVKPYRRLAVAVAACFLMSLAALTAVIVMPSMTAHGSTTLKSLAAQIKALRGKEDSAPRKAALVADLCERGYAVWGGNDAEIRRTFTDLSEEVHESVTWALAHDHALAVEMMANGHRSMRDTPGYPDWAAMVDKAETLTRGEWTKSSARLALGVALAHWEDDPDRAWKMSKRAVAYFHAHGPLWDEASALRHQGLSANRHLAERLPLYQRALAEFDRLGDDRGRASTYLSISQAGDALGTSESVAIPLSVHYGFQAAVLLKRLESLPYLLESIQGLVAGLKKVGRSPEYDDARRFAREEFRKGISLQEINRDSKGACQNLLTCLELDMELAEDSEILSDLVQASAAIRHAVNGDSICAWYLAKCRRTGVVPDQAITSMVHAMHVDLSLKPEPHTTNDELIRFVKASVAGP